MEISLKNQDKTFSVTCEVVNNGAQELTLNLSRFMTMSPLYPCGKPYSAGTHNEIVKKLAPCHEFDRSSQDRTTAVALFNGHFTPRKENAMKNTLSKRLI